MDAQAAICKLCRFDLRCWCLVLQLNPECSQFDKSDFSRGELGKHLFVDPDCGKHAPEPGQVSWWVIVCGWQLRMWSGASFFLRTKTQFSFLAESKKEGYWLINVDQSFFFPRLWMSRLTGDSWCVLVFGRPNWALEAGRTRVGGRNGRNGTIQMNPLNPILNPNDVQRWSKMYKDCKIYKPKKKHEETVTLNEKNRIRLHALHWLCLQYLAIAAWQRVTRMLICGFRADCLRSVLSGDSSLFRAFLLFELH